VTIKTLRRRLDRIESDRVGKLPVLMIWDDGVDPDIELQAEKAERECRQLMALQQRDAMAYWMFCVVAQRSRFLAGRRAHYRRYRTDIRRESLKCRRWIFAAYP
jgi:hypothetical protein